MLPISCNAVGDIIAVVQLCITILEAWNSSRGAKAEHQELKERFKSLLPVLCACERNYESLSDRADKKAVFDQISWAYKDISHALNRLAKFKFDPLNTPSTQQPGSASSSKPSRIRIAWESITWELRGAPDVSKCFAKLARVTDSLSVVLAAANGTHANRELAALRNDATATRSGVEVVATVATFLQDAAAASAARGDALYDLATSTNAVSVQTADDVSRLLRDSHAAQAASLTEIQRSTDEILGQVTSQTRLMNTFIVRLDDSLQVAHNQQAGEREPSRVLDQPATALEVLDFLLSRCIKPRLQITAVSGVVPFSPASRLSTRDVTIGCIAVLVTLAVSAPTATQQATYASYACLYVCVAFATRLFKTPTNIRIVFVVDFFSDSSPVELAIEDARSPETFHNALLRHFHGKYGYTITVKRRYNVVIKDKPTDAGQPLPGSETWAGLVRAGQRLFLDAMVRQASEGARVQLSCPSCGKPQPAGCMEAQRLMKCAVCPVSFGQVEQADFTPITGDNTPSFSEIDRVASLEDELNRCKRIMVLGSQRLQLRTEDQGVEQEPESRALRSVWVSYGGGGGGGGGMPQGYIHGLSKHYSGLQISPQTYIQYDMELVDGNTYNATVWLRNFKPPAYYVGRGSSAMAAKESAAFTAGRALGLWW